MPILRKKRKSVDETATKTKGAPFEEAYEKSGLSDVDSLSTDLGFDPHAVVEGMMKFGKALTGVQLYSYQEVIAYRIFYSVITMEGAVITVLLSRQSGKTEALAFVINTMAVIMPVLAKLFPSLEQFSEGIKMGLFAPQGEQMQTTYNRAMLRLSSDNATLLMRDPEIDTELTSTARLSLTNGSFLKGQIASKQSKIESKTYDVVFLEEAQDLDDYIVEKSIEPMLTATGGTLIKIGTTGTMKNHYWYEIQRNRNKDRKIVDHRLLNHIQFDYKAIIKARRNQYELDGKRYHLHYEADVKRKIERWGKDSQAFRLGYSLEWDLETGMLLTDKDWERITNRKKGLGLKDGDDTRYRFVAGLDLAKDYCSTVLTIGKIIGEDATGNKIKQIVDWIELQGMDYEAQHHVIMQALVEYDVEVLFLDYTGVGKPVGDRLMYACGDYIHIEPYTFSKQSKSEMWYALTAAISSGRIVVPSNKKAVSTKEYARFEEQMMNCTKFFDGPYLVCQKSDGYLDDYVDSLGLMNLAGDYQLAEVHEIEEDDNPFFAGILAQRDSVRHNSY